MFQPCANPECEYPANPDPQVSVGFCCEKCEGRFNGEEWASSGKKKHTAYCTSKSMDDSSWGGGGAADAWGGGFASMFGGGGAGQKCMHPECNYLVNSDPAISTQFCCEKCEGLFNGEEWAEGGKRHYKNCEKIEADGSGGDGGWGGGGGSWGKAGKGGWGGDDSWGPYGAMGGMKGMMMMMKGKMQAMKGDGGGWSDGGGFGKGGKGGMGGKSTNPMAQFKPEQKVWIGNIPEGVTYPHLKQHFNEAGSHPKHVNVNTKNMTGSAAFDTPEEAAEAILLLNGSAMGDQLIQVDSWTSG